MTRDEFTDEHRPIRFAVVVHFFNGPRGYVVSVPVGECASVVKKLAEKVDLSGASEITYAEILLGEDEF